MKFLVLGILCAFVQGEEYPVKYCDTDIYAKYTQCSDFAPRISGYVYDTATSIKTGHLAICYGDWPACSDIQKIAVTDAGNCHVGIWRSYTPKLNELFTPCENPLPPRLVEKQFCTWNGGILSEYYGKLYTDVIRHNINEQFTYDQVNHVIIAKSNGECLEGVSSSDPSNLFYFDSVKTAPCNSTNIKQKWFINNDKIETATSHTLVADTKNQGSLITAGYDGLYTREQKYFVDCSYNPVIEVHIVSSRGKRISEYYSGLYVDDVRNNLNEKFIWDRKNLMFKSASANQCLDSYLDTDGKYKVHTYPCDVNNPNQRWKVIGKMIIHATHTSQCLDADPTYPDHHLQMWECIYQNQNQEWTVEPIT